MFHKTYSSKIYPETYNTSKNIDNIHKKIEITTPKNIKNAWPDPVLESVGNTEANEESYIDELFERSIANDKRLLPRQMKNDSSLVGKPNLVRQDTISGILTKEEMIRSSKQFDDTKTFDEAFTAITEMKKQKKE
jgi:hypothetical protein